MAAQVRAGACAPSVLFLCIHNAGRSQMAAALLEAAAPGVRVRSAGSDPAAQVNAAAVAVMAELGIDIASRTPSRLTDQAVRDADIVVTMGCGDACPVLPGVSYRDWALEDPAGRPVDEVRAIRDRIRALVAELADEIA